MHCSIVHGLINQCYRYSLEKSVPMACGSQEGLHWGSDVVKSLKESTVKEEGVDSGESPQRLLWTGQGLIG